MCRAFLLLCFLGFSTLLSAQIVKVTGTVVDAAGRPVGGAVLTVLNTDLSAASGDNGRFSLSKTPAGTVDIHVTAPGYASVTVRKDVKADAGNVVIVLSERQLRLDEVVVTAQKREENVQSVPAGISVISAARADEYRLWNTKDLSAVVPNLYSAGPGDNRNVSSIRGIATTSYEQAVATYVDGVNQFGLDTYIAQLQDIERIEVLRGPQGTLYGRNAMGGVINIITKKPGNRTSAFIEESAGNFGQQRLSVGLRTPLVAGKLYLGSSGLYSSLGGFYTNAFDNSAFDKQSTVSGNHYLKWLAADRFSLTLNVKHVANRNRGTFPLASSIADALQDPYVLNQNAKARLVDNVFNSSLSLNYAGPAFNFSMQTAYQHNNRYYREPIDADFSPIDGVSLVNDYGSDWNTVNVLTNELRFSSPAASTSSLKWTAGTFAFRQDAPTKVGTHFGADAALVGAPFPFFTSINTNDGTSSGAAVFGQVSYALAPKLDLTAGLRYDFERKTQAVRGEFQPDGAAAMVTRSDTSARRNFHAVSPKVSLAYAFSEQRNIYASYSRGFRAGGISQLASDPSQPPLFSYEPEYSNNYEIGLKNTFAGDRVRLNLSGFYTTVRNAQVPTLVLPDAVTLTRNAGKLSSKGLEAELSAAVLNGLDLNYAFGYTDATYSTLIVPANGAPVNLAGTRQVFTPKTTSALGAQYTVGISPAAKLLLHGDWRQIGTQFFDLANQQRQQGYGLLNARVGVATKRAELYLWGSNLSDKTYVDYAYDFGAAHLGNPRTYGLTLKLNVL